MNEYGFCVVWDDDEEKGSAYSIRAKDRDEAWEKICIDLVTEARMDANDYGGIPKVLTSVSLQHVRRADEKIVCAYCSEKVGPNPRHAAGEIWHDECWMEYESDNESSRHNPF